MPDQPAAPTPPPPTPPPPPPAARPGHVPMSEEFDRAKWTLPPAAPVLIVLGVLAIIVGIVAWIGRPKPQSSGEIVSVFAMQQPDQQSVLVEVQLNLRNLGKKPMRIRSIQAELSVPGQTEPLKDEAASAVDFDRYFQAFPELKEHATAPIPIESDIAPGAQQQGMVIFGFPVTKEAFEQRQQLRLTLALEDRPSLVIPPPPK
jgi:hypothetical protein